MDVCPTKAISFKAGKITLYGPEIIHAAPEKKKRIRARRIIAWSLALAVLVGALVYFNQPDASADPNDSPAAESAATAMSSDAESTEDVSDAAVIAVGKEVGMRAPDFTVPVYGSETTFALSDYRGKTVIVNFWATWCTPCCNELPYFDEVHQKYGDQVAVVAIHSDLVTDDVEAYLAKFDYQMPFALDETGGVIKSFGGSTMLPQTIIVDADGIITYNAVGSVTLEKLESLLNAASAEIQ